MFESTQVRNRPVLITLLLGLLLVTWPLFVKNAELYLQVLGMACLYGALALAWNLYALTGSISLGHAAFFGLGAYGAALLELHLHWSPALAIPLGALAGAGYGALLGLVFRRMRGAYLALATLASVEIPKTIADNWDSLTHGSLGLVGIPGLTALLPGTAGQVPGSESISSYYLLLGLLFLVGWIHKYAMDSKWGWAIRSVRENEVAASMLGIDVLRTRFTALVLSAFLTAVCGAAYAHLVGLLEPSLVFNLHISAMPLVLSIFGGRYQYYGPILGALILYPLDQLIFHPWLPAGHAALYGVVIMLTILFVPHGIAAWLQQRFKFVCN